MEDLLCSLRISHDTAVGQDQIHYQFLKHLPTNTLSHLLKIFNAIWTSGNIHKSSQEALIIPIQKPGKDHKEANKYRPIASTSCLCKTVDGEDGKQLTNMDPRIRRPPEQLLMWLQTRKEYNGSPHQTQNLHQRWIH